MTAGGYHDYLLLAILPYVAMFVFFLVTIHRYRAQSFTYSSLSSQFLENRQHFWGLVPFHYGVLVVLTGHFIAFMIPRELLLWNSKPLRLYVLEIAALIFGLLTLIGLISIIVRRLSDPKVTIVTSTSDWIIYLLLLVQVASGVYVAVFHPWGSSWFAAAMSPYLGSLVTLRPEIGYVAARPWMVKLHLRTAWLIPLAGTRCRSPDESASHERTAAGRRDSRNCGRTRTRPRPERYTRTQLACLPISGARH